MRYKIILTDKVDSEIIKKIKAKHSSDVEGIDKLYDGLIANGTCDSDTVSRIYYTAYTLSLENIEMIIARMN